ncbi:unnamed protein product [Cuscuta europaea]|uniref:FAF domain-containing protein n=1 Tax=Cuscuta europaea TaxID=41803 RepID=A0A9P0Z3T3_CUSEU|nr:unnamed protein product [Cuscuta europaea]
MPATSFAVHHNNNLFPVTKFLMVNPLSGGHCDDKKLPHLRQKPSTDTGGWSFLVEELAANKGAAEDDEAAAAEAVKKYVQLPPPLPPPRRKSRSLSALSTKSLEMCTEGLGCETGFDITLSVEELIGKPPPPEPSPTKPAGMITGDKINKSKAFPPALSSSKGRAGLDDGVKMMRPRREGGRLVLTAISVTRPDSFFLASRSDGRLMLSFKMASNNGSEADDDDINEV